MRLDDDERTLISSEGGPPWACVTMSVTHDASGRSQSMAMHPLRSVPMWLAGIDADRVAPHVREKLVRLDDDEKGVGTTDTPAASQARSFPLPDLALVRHPPRSRPTCRPEEP